MRMEDKDQLYITEKMEKIKDTDNLSSEDENDVCKMKCIDDNEVDPSLYLTTFCNEGLDEETSGLVGNKSEDTNNENNKSDDTNNDENLKSENENDFQSPQKLELLTGFLRCLNFVSVSTAMFGLVFSLYNPQQTENILNHLWISLSGSHHGNTDLNSTVTITRQFGGCIQLVYIIVASVIIVIDSIATVTFRWKEYGELTHRHTDATSILFHLSKSRWRLRFVCSLAILSTASLTASKIIANSWGTNLERKSGQMVDTTNISSLSRLGQHAIIWYLSLMSGSLLSYIIGYLLHLCFNHVPWLDDEYIEDHVDDCGDKWKTLPQHKDPVFQSSTSFTLSQNNVPSFQRSMSYTLSQHDIPAIQGTISYQFKHDDEGTSSSWILIFLERFVISCCFIFQAAIVCGTLYLMDTTPSSLEFVVSIVNLVSCCLISVFALVNTSIVWFSPGRNMTPVSSALCLPFVMSSGVTHLLEVSRGYHRTQYFFACSYITLTSLFFLIQFVRLLLNSYLFKVWPMTTPSSCQLLNKNFLSPDGAYKKVIRVFDTLGTFLALVGLILGIFSIFVDQYDLDFKPKGDLKEITDAMKGFKDGIDQVQAKLEKIYSELNLEITCQHIYDALTGGLIASGILSIVPGGGFLSSSSAKAAYYSIKIGDSLTKLSKSLGFSAKKLWKIGTAVRKVLNVTWTLTKTLHAGGITATLIKMMMFLPPVIVGIYILFSAFWPRRVLFFHKSQRNKFVSGQFTQWLGVLVGLVLALVINTALMDAIMDEFNDQLDPYLHLVLVKKLGWRLAIAASTFSIAGALAFCVSNLCLMVKTDKDHENLTNEELDWKNELEKRQLVSFSTPHGPKIERINQIKYKKEVIGPWTWCLPISLCILACSFGIAANLYPKFDMHREPNGVFAKSLEKVWTKIDPVFGSWSERMNQTKRVGEEECLPYASLHDVLSMNLGGSSRILMNPIHAFFNETDKLIKPLREVLIRTRGQLISDVGDSFAGQAINQTFQDLHLNSEYIGLILLTPRLMNLLILLFGCIMASRMVCDMAVSVDPAKIVQTYGSICMFSIIYVLGSQLVFFNILSGIGVPFYTITIRLGLGFIYDLVCDSILASIYIGMKNEYFFVIPKRKQTVTYSIPGVSDSGPNVPNQII